MKTKDYVTKAWIFCSFAMLTALILLVSPYLSEGAVVEVDTIEELYAEVNNQNNAGNTIKLLAAGSPYVLTPNDPNGQPRANGGSLVPKNGMHLQGENVYVDYDGDGVFDPRDDDGDGVLDIDADGNEIYEDPQTKTIIDGSLLNVPVPGLGVVAGTILIVGAVEVSISNVTVRGGPRTQAEIDIRGPGNSSSNVTVRECTLELGRRGINVHPDIRWGSDNATVTLNAERNVIRNHIVPGVVMGWGIQTQTAVVSGTELFIFLIHNRCYGNKMNLFLEKSGVNDGLTTVVSQGNIYEEAVLTLDLTLRPVLSGGIVIQVRDFPGGGAFPMRGSFRNLIRLISNGDAILNNEGWAGVYVEGLKRSVNNTEFRDNEIDVELLRTRFVRLKDDGTFDGPQNREARVDPGKTVEEQPMLRRDITIVGANISGSNLREPPPGGLTGPARDNKVKLKVKEAMTSLMPTSYDNNPQPFVAIDNAPDQVEVELELEEINYIGS